MRCDDDKLVSQCAIISSLGPWEEKMERTHLGRVEPAVKLLRKRPLKDGARETDTENLAKRTPDKDEAR